MEDDSKSPKRLFRFFRPKDAELFEKKRLFFSRADSFNDPFEVCPRYDKMIPEMIDKALRMHFALNPPQGASYLTYERLNKPKTDRLLEEYSETSGPTFQKKFSDYYGIVCFCARHDCLLMWGHYTEGHTGFAVEFDPSHSLFNPRDFGKVEYSVDRCIMSLETNSGMLLRKSSEWEYEQEYRLIRKRDELDSVLGDDGKTVVAHSFSLPIVAVKAIYFGIRMSAEKRRTILDSIQPYAHIGIYFMRMHRTEYRLEAAPWSEWKEPSTATADLILSLPWDAKNIDPLDSKSR